MAAGPEKGREGTDGKSNVQSLWVWGLGPRAARGDWIQAGGTFDKNSQDLVSVSHVPDVSPVFLLALTPSVLTITLSSRHYYYLRFMDEDTKAQERLKHSPRSHRLLSRI